MFFIWPPSFLLQLIVTILAVYLIPVTSGYDDQAYRKSPRISQTESGLEINLVRRSRTESLRPRAWYSNAVRARDMYPIHHRGIDTGDHIASIFRKSIIAPLSPNRSLSAGIFQDGNDYSYFAQVNFGSKASMMYMLLDTGAAMTWVMGSNCKNPICTSRNTFGSQNSSTLKLTDDRFSVNYGTGYCSGIMAEDKVSFAGLNLHMPFGIADTVSQDFGSFEMYGILGLSLSKSESPSFVDAIVHSKALKNNMFAISLSQTKDGANTGVINFGSPDPSRFTGDLKYYPLAADGEQWKLILVSAGFADAQIALNRNALLDTGSSYIFAPLSDSTRLHALIPGSSTPDEGVSWQVPCDTTVPLKFQFGLDQYSVPSSVWVTSPDSNGMCQSNIGGVDSDQWVLGDFFLKNFYVAFDIEKRKIGLATAKLHTSSPMTPSTTKPSNVPNLSTPSEGAGPLDSDTISQSSNASPTELSSSVKSDSNRVYLSTYAIVIILATTINF